MSGPDSGNLGQIMERVFRSHEDISYIAIVNDKLEVITQEGFIELHPSKLHILHVQAALLVNMCSVWSESLGDLDYSCASFDSKSEIIGMRLPNKQYLVAVLSSIHKKNLENIRMDIVRKFSSVKVRPN
jgi:hypothetical protein